MRPCVEQLKIKDAVYQDKTEGLNDLKAKVKEDEEDKNSLEKRFENVESELIKAQEDRDQDSEIEDLR